MRLINDAPSRRAVLLGGLAALAPLPAWALTEAEARAFIGALVGEVTGVINSGQGEGAMLRSFEQVFRRYADVAIIAQTVLGVDWRRASAAQRQGFTDAFAGYISRKYGRRFREFIGGTVTVTGSRQIRNFYEITSIANLRGEDPFEVRWLVSDASGRTQIFNVIIAGINVSTQERTEIGAMLDRRGGNLDRLIADLRGMG